MSEARTVLLKVLRYRPGDPKPHYDEFRVSVGPRTTVLDALLAVRRRQDPSLTLRHSCLHASCGSCGMRVNGREVLACVTRLDGLGDRVVVEPLAGAPLVGDLVVDVSGFYGRSEPVGRPLVRSAGVVAAARGDGAPAAGGVASPELDEFERFEDCLECGLCLSACPVAASDPRYLGPAALAAAERLLEEPRGVDREAVLGWVDDAQGAWRCHLAFECSEVCPAGLDPAGAIMRLRRRLLRDRLSRLAGRHDREGRP
jgi:succinate dehydrogenase / fumarate reductase iron-sulfur subunit